MKDTICLIAGVIGGFIATLLGGWDSALVTLVVFMSIDFVTGIVTAAMGKSKHSESGTLNSTAGWGRSCKEVLYSSYGSGRRENRYSYRYKLYQRCSLYQFLPE